jgi:DNA (cytosine-5)-methyltransferase 1
MLKILELFGGIGACSKALERLGIDFEIVDYVEIDKYAVKSFNAIHGTNFEPQDITTWDKDIEVDLIMHGSPCQDFSLAGKQAGGDKDSGTRSSLMYETIRIVEKLKPKYVIWENVKNLLSKKHRHNFDSYLEIMEQLGYKNYYQVLNAKDYGIPQNRERVFTISIRKDLEQGFEFPEKKELKLKLKDMLEDKVDEKYYLTESNIKTINRNFGSKGKILNLDEFSLIEKMTYPSRINQKINETICPTLTSAMGTGGGNVPVINQKNDRLRKLTSKECWRLMGFDDEDFEKAQKVNSNTQLYKQAGNSIVVNVLENILKKLL